MKIVRVVRLTSTDKRYGGQTAVALDRGRVVIASGDVTLLTGTHGFTGRLPDEIDGVAVQVFAARQAILGARFAGGEPSTLRQLRSLFVRADAVRVSAARNLLNLAAAARAHRYGTRHSTPAYWMVDQSIRLLDTSMPAVPIRRMLHGPAAVFHRTSLDAHHLGGAAQGGPRLYESPAERRLGRRGDRGRRRVASKVGIRLSCVHDNARVPLLPRPAALRYPPTCDVPHDRLRRRPESSSSICRRQRWAKERGPLEATSRPSHPSASKPHANFFVSPSVNAGSLVSVVEVLRAGLPAVVTEGRGLARAIRRFSAQNVLGKDRADVAPAVAHCLSGGPEWLAAAKPAIELIGSAITTAPLVQTVLKECTGEKLSLDERAEA